MLFTKQTVTMAQKKINSFGGLVYSTDPNFKPEMERVEEDETLLPAQQKLKILLDKKNRTGKEVTLSEGIWVINDAVEE